MKAHLFAGQSNISHLWGNTASGTPEDGTFMWDGSSWVAPVNALIAFANSLKAATGKPVYILPAAVSNAALLPESAPIGATYNYWTNRVDASSPLKLALAMVAASGAELASVVWGQGERECETPVATPRLVAGYSEVHAALAGAAGLAPKDLPFVLCPTAHWVTNFPTGGRRVLEAQWRAIEEVRGFVAGPHSYDLGTYDGGHLDEPSRITFAQRIAASVTPIVGIAQSTGGGGGGSSSPIRLESRAIAVDVSRTTPFTINDLRFKPAGAILQAGGAGWLSSFGVDDLSGGNCNYSGPGSVGGFMPYAYPAAIVVSSGNFWKARITAVSDDSATFTPVKEGSPTGTYTLNITFIG